MRLVNTVLKSLLITFVILIVLFALVIGVYPRMLKAGADKLVLAPLNLTSLADGTYRGSARVLHVAASLSVVVQDHRITDVSYVEKPSGAEVPKLAAEVVTAQSLSVDAVSGATISTKVTLKAIDNALGARP